ncbi:MAG: tRNA (N(6)-L-threonylcarbamoyladenosine(37)-C(2))-methylthiotransferase MtaB [Anaerolineae bacterium]|nr:tRNA (N(6)-L-threonylcarbamoyladenosine(37)-C(2))-methylthiotransferase MtaB [Anaerolineae bacterium]
MNVYLHSLGCRLNQSEIQELARQFAAAGCAVVETPGEADVCVVNTCVVTAQAERKSRHVLSALHRQNPHARVAAIGCYPTFAPERLAAAPEIAWSIPNADKERTVALVTGGEPAPATAMRPAFRTRAFVKVQEGCENHCTYCIVRYLRGPARSWPLDDVVATVRAHVAAGYREVVLTGVNLGAYGRDLGHARSLHELVAALLERTEVARLRLSSLEPWDVEPDFFGLWEDARLCRHLHLPLQSGCDATLRRMGRRNTTAAYARLVAAARAAIPDLSLTTDVMVGFPGEDAPAFEESLAFVEQMDFARLHVFPYSLRPGTAAARLAGRVPWAVCQERAARMRALGARQAAAFAQRFVGREMTVLWERRRSNGRYHGLTDTYVTVVARHTDDLCNAITRTRLVAIRGDVLEGEVIE